MASKLPLLIFLLFIMTTFLSISFYYERKRAKSEEIRQVIMEAERNLDQTRKNLNAKQVS